MRRYPAWFASHLPTLALFLILLFSVRVDARLYPGHFEWKEFRSGEVVVYYPAGYEAHARMLAATSHEYLDSLELWYGDRPPIARIVVNPDMDASRAMALINPTRIEIPIAVAMDKGLRPQSSLFLDRVTAHELTHVYQLNKREGLAKYLVPLFGEAVAPVTLAPDWLLEGQAIWTESAKGGGRLYSSYQGMQMRTQLAQVGSYWSLDRISSAGRVNPPLNRAYTGGAYLYGSLPGEFRSKLHVQQWMNLNATWPGFTGWSFSRAYDGRTLKEQWTALENAHRDRLRLRIRSLYAAGYAVGTPLLENSRTSYHHPKWTPEGQLVVAERSYAHPDRLIMLSPALAYHEEVLAYTGVTAHDGLTPFLDGVIISEIRRGILAPEQNESVLVRVRSDGAVGDLVYGGLNGWAPAFNMETMTLAYVGSLDNGGMGLRTIEFDSTGRVQGVQQQWVSTRLGHISDPAWNEDGTLLAFTGDLGDGERVYVLDTRTAEMLAVTIANALATWDPAFGPNDELWASADVDGIFNLYEVDLTSKTAVQRSRVMTGALEPAVSPDGSQVAYAHYTAEGFNVALLDSTRWLDQPVGVLIEAQSRSVFAAPDTLLDTEVFGVERDYNPLRHMAPNYAMPFGSTTNDEMGLGIRVFGRDPIGILSWNVAGSIGLESQMPSASANITYRDLPVDLSLSAFSYPDELVEVSIVPDNFGGSYYEYESVWKQQLDLGLTAFQRIHLDHGKWRTTALPFIGLIQRMGHRQTNIEDGLEARSYLGARIGGTFMRHYSALRDPIPSRLESVRLVAERGIPDMDMEGDLFELGLRKHFPGPLTNTVVALKGAVQAQNGDLNFSRARVRPRGYADDDLSSELRGNGRILFGGAEFHFPLWYADHGLPGLGYLYLERVSGSLFAEGSTGWGGGRSLTDWTNDYGVASLGGVLSLRGWLFFQADTRLDVGTAWRPEYEDVAVFVSLSFPELLDFIGDSPDWEQLVD